MKIGILVFVLFIILGLGAFYTITDTEAKKNKEIQQLYSNITYYDERYMEEDLFATYNSLLSKFPDDYKLLTEYISACEKYGRSGAAIDGYYKAFEMNNTESRYAVKIAKNYVSNGEITSAINFVKKAMQTVEDSAELEEIYNSQRYLYKTYKATYDEVFNWHNGYAKVEKGGLYGFIDNSGTQVVAPVYEEIGALSTELGYFSAVHRDKYVYLNSSGYRKLVPNSDYTYLGAVENGYANCEKDGVWGFFSSGNQEGLFEFEYTGQFVNNICAAKRNGQWELLIAGSFESLTGDKYDDIKLDDYGCCVSGGIIFAKKDGSWIMLNTSGERIGSLEFEDVKRFASGSEAAAVKKSGKWGFVNVDGTWFIEPAYEDADSFSLGYAPVKSESGWNYIDVSGRVCITGDFSEAKCFNSTGLTAVRYGEKWYLIRLYEYI